jgi:hypothetical protein
MFSKLECLYLQVLLQKALKVQPQLSYSQQLNFFVTYEWVH